MKRLLVMVLTFAALAVVASAQGMTGSSNGKGADTGSMMAPADTSTGTSSMNGPTDSMMAEDMSYEGLKKANKLADVSMGMTLRVAMSSGMKVQYKNLMSAEALAAKSPTVLFFAADWCPYCQADLTDINANGSRLGKVNVVVVDFDKSADLRSKYGVTAQDTYVQIGGMGEKLAAWNGGGVEGILKNLKKGM
jgi:thiol-disulfide isomerase/thioredoxin